MKAFTLAAVSCLLIATVVFADSPKVSLHVKDTQLSQVASELSKQANVKILVDPNVTGAVSADLNELDLDQVLSLITQGQGYRWHKLYAMPDESGGISMEQVRAQLRALETLQDTPMVVFDPATRKQTVFARMNPTDAEKGVDPAKLGLMPFYYLSKPEAPPTIAKQEEAKPDDSPIARQLADLDRERAELFAQMSPAEQRAIGGLELSSMLSMPADYQVQMMSSMFRAAQNLDPASRDQLMRSLRGAMRSVGIQTQRPQRGTQNRRTR